MLVSIVLVLESLIQLLASLLALRLLRVTGWRWAWSLIAFALFLMVLRRGLPIFAANHIHLASGTLGYELLGLAISVLLAIGLWKFSPYFIDARNTASDLARSNESLMSNNLVLNTTNDELNATTEELEAACCNLEKSTAELRNSERALAEAQRMAEIGSWELDIATGTAKWSANMYRVMDVEPGDPAVRTVEYFAEHLVHPADRERVLGILQAAVANSQSYEVQYRITWRDGSEHFIHARGEPVPPVAGQPAKMRGTLQDFTAARRIEAALETLNEQLSGTNEELNATNEELGATNQELATTNENLRATAEELEAAYSDLEKSTAELHSSENKYRTLMENLPQKIFVKDRNSVFVNANSNFAADMGLPLEQLIGTTDYDYYPADLADKYCADDRRIMDQGRTVELEERYLKDGQLLWIQTVKTPFHNEDGEIVGIQGIFWDITERKQAELALKESRDKLDAALASMTDAVFISDTAGNFIEFNDAFASFHKFQNKEECAKTFAEYPDLLDVFMNTGELAPVEMWAVPRALRGEVGVNVEYSLRRKDTGDKWVGSYSFAPIRDEAGAIVGSVVVGRDITEYKHSQQALLTAMERLKLAQLAANTGVWDWNVVTGEIEWTEQMFRLFGLDQAADPASFNAWKQTLHPDDALAAELKIMQALQDQTELENEYRVLLPGGQLRWIFSAGRGIYDPAGKPVRMIGTCVDITARKLAEEELVTLNEQLSSTNEELSATNEELAVTNQELHATSKELESAYGELEQTNDQLQVSETRYRRLFESAKDGILILDAETGIVVDVNPFITQLLGYSREQIEGKHIWDLGVFKDIAASEDHFLELQRQEFVRYEDLPLETAAGRRIAMEFVSNVYLVNGQKVIQCNIRDISERVEAAAQLRQSEEEYRILYSSSQDALMTFAPPTWGFTSGNQSALAMFEAENLEEFTANSPVSLSPVRQPDGRFSADVSKEMVEQALRDGFAHFEWVHKRLSGEEFPADVLLTRLERDGSPFIQATVRDLTEKRALQASVAQSDRLATMGMLAAGVAHEINNPLTYVLYNNECLVEELPKVASVMQRCYSGLREHIGEEGLSQIVGGSEGTSWPDKLDELVSFAREASQGTRRIKEIVRSLGAFSRVEQNDLTRIDMNYSIECAINMAHNEIKYRARLVKNLGLLPAVMATEGKLSQVFLNLLINAAHAIDSGDMHNDCITIRTWAMDSNVFAEVADTGKGISPEHLKHIFDPFFTTKEVGAGTGLGLAISKSIITSFGGDIQAESPEGMGARFIVRLPAALAVQEQLGINPAPAPHVVTTKGRLMVVDDEEAIRVMLERALLKEHQVVCAASGDAARGILQQDGAFDLILCDLMMPGISGMELHEWLVTHNPTLANKMVFLTGGVFTPSASEYLARVGNLKIEKPFDMYELKHLVMEKVLQNQSSGQPASGGAR